MRLVTASTLPKSDKDLPNVIGGLRLMITEMAQRSAGRSLGTSCQTLGRVLIKMGLVSNGWSMSALSPKADMYSAPAHVRFVPIADITASRTSTAR
jgi:hypothetical protein